MESDTPGWTPTLYKVYTEIVGNAAVVCKVAKFLIGQQLFVILDGVGDVLMPCKNSESSGLMDSF